ncbi:DNA-binding protein [Roseovarius sp. MMSF_3350]|uniref:DNA-binding protein n=2 Tax=unclassified Roseovarius TaxID=2614913 RepID=UPI00274023FC|nr:DNA-binding protein [Roseovarius sp. MMSF_3350]
MPSLDFPPRLMPAPVAARYIGVSESTLRTLDIPRRELGSKRLYDRFDLDAYASDLPYEGGAPVDGW